MIKKRTTTKQQPRERLRAATCSDFLRDQVANLKSAGWIAHAKEFETAITALRVIHIWATFDGGRCLNPQDVAKLTRKALKGFISSSPNAEAIRPAITNPNEA